MAISLAQAQRLAAQMEKELDKRKPTIDRWDRYYGGKHRLGFATDRFQAAFGGMFKDWADNWCGVVCDAPAERLEVIGFRVGDGTGAMPENDDIEARKFWQRNAMDAESKIALLESIVKSRSFMLVWADDPEADEPQPEITVEDPTQTIVGYKPGGRRKRAAAFKRWEGEDGFSYATLYLADELWKFRRPSTASGSSLILPAGVNLSDWQPRNSDENEYRIDNPLGKVPIVEIANRRRLLADPKPEHEWVIPLQDAVNKLVADMMVAAEAGAFPARWGTGIDLPKDPKTGQEIDDPELWRLSVAKLLRASNPGARFGNFQAADLQNFTVGIELLVTHIAAQTRTPPHYLMGKLVNVSSDTISAAEAGMVAKCRDKTTYAGEDLEEVTRLCFGVLNDPRQDNYFIETIWRDVEYRSEAQHIDALTKKKTIGVPWRQLMEDAGYTQTQIDRMQQWREQDASLGGADAGGIDSPPPGGDPVPPTA